MTETKFKFIDLFAGIGGFHLAMEKLGGNCVFASEIDEDARRVYEDNFGLAPHGDITKIDEKSIPFHDLLCGGFPCQSFSKAGNREGISDPRGTLFFDIIRIAKHHKPSYILLENVRNLAGHDNGNTWKVIKYNLEKIGYNCPEFPSIFSPHYLGIPQFRERVFIFCKRKDLGEVKEFSFLKSQRKIADIKTVLQADNEIPNINKYRLKDDELTLIELWNDFIKIISGKLPGFPIWTDFLKKDIEKDLFAVMPKWKQIFIEKNNKLFLAHEEAILNWLKRAESHPLFYGAKSKFEWQVGKNAKADVWRNIMQFRPSGLRVKPPTYFPALVAITQTSIIGDRGRRITPREAARLQNFPDSYKLAKDDRLAYKQLGNAVNVALAELFGAHLLGSTDRVRNILNSISTTK